ncbi:ABC-3 protein [Magnetococcus marinus MC-1]|uniref:High-affinity zinc uptake system membrane protein ZnuB n=1 Tax=Magnetococcus marinus (strain ATCC BAA-1437 / JCM 17883 / MC-1) TaxID=156889 RepID=A0LCH7_MAGMM|nr:iron chelate uptake ABC transporter family permease subunit [Magnetococcus marinus]ABK45670.1 ABC-3 protein [Magnetococcus marinus MC-1]
MWNDFMLLAWVAGVGVALVSGPLGCFVVWRRMAYFGDTMAHGALLGVALGLIMALNLTLAVVLVCIAIALILLMLQSNSRVSGDTLLGILSHSALSLGLVGLSFMSGLRVDLMAYLFGDILAVSWQDLGWIYGGGALVLLLLWRIWNPLLALTLHEGLARAEGVPVTQIRLIFMLLIAVVIAVAMKIVGILLITSLLIVPAAAARNLSRSPEQMAGWAVVVGVLAVSGGLWGSLNWDTPSGPSIVVVGLGLFLLSLPVGWWLLRRGGDLRGA